jgi:membrane associated rhomboid family serine protease
VSPEHGNEPRYCYRHPDRETGLSCSECGRPICVDCMTIAPVGIRCPEHAGSGVHGSGTRGMARALRPRRGAPVTMALVAVNVLLFLVELSQGGSSWNPAGSLFQNGALYGPLVAAGDWWRLITSAFLHANVLHIGMNMLALWWFGRELEAYIGSLRFALFYFVCALAGSAGSLIAEPNVVAIGASGAIFGVLGAFVTIEWLQTRRIGGPALTLVIINLAFSFAVPNIAWGGHIGGLVGGILGTLALARFGRGHPAYGRLSLVSVAALVAIGVVSVALAYWKVGTI